MRVLESITYRNSLKKQLPLVVDKNASFFITGASGLIGSYLIDLLHVDNLQGANHKIYALGRNKEKLANRFPYNDENLIFIEQNICEPITITDSVDYVFHAASNADPRAYALYPAETLLTNVDGTKNSLEYAKKVNANFLLTSTFEVYGKMKDHDVYCESDYGITDLDSTRSCYPESKRTAEVLTRCYSQEFGLRVVIGRLCSIYGPTMQQSDSKAHAQFIRNALNNEDVVLKSKGLPRRTYMYVADAVNALLTIMVKGKSGEAYNISNERSVASIAEVAKTVADYAGKKVVFDLPDDIEKAGFSKPQNCILDNQKLRMLGWNGMYSLEDGIKETIDILRGN